MELAQKAFRKNYNILYLKKKEFDIFYSKKYKYPIVVVETVDKNTGKSQGSKKIIRSEIEDPFKPDKELPLNSRLSIKDYTDYMEYGGSMGHNAPAGFHKTNISVYNETFLLSNMCPQEIVFNSGLWVILENFCKRLQNELDLYDIKVYTGSIPGKKNQIFNKTELNVPSHMFKVVTAKHQNHKGKFFIGCFLMENKPPKERIFKIYKYLVSLKHLSDLSGINFFKLFNHYQEFNPIDYSISSLNKVTRIDVKFNKMLSKQMHSSSYYGVVVYSKNLQELESNWEKTKKAGFNDEFHEFYYDLAKKRIKREMKSKKSSKKVSISKKSSKKASNKKESNKKASNKKGSNKKGSNKKSSKKSSRK